MTHSRSGSATVQDHEDVAAVVNGGPLHQANQKAPPPSPDPVNELVQRKIDDVEDELLPEAAAIEESHQQPTNPKGREYVWRNIIFFVYLHIGAAYGLYLALTQASWFTLAWFEFLVITSGWGITAGAHRLWAHRSYKAKLPVRIAFMILNCIAAQNHVIEWSRDHRVHHKFSETDADPHDARRGLFFSHMGWLMVRKHPEVKRKGRLVDMSDLERDPLLAFQRRFYIPLMFFFNYAFPVLVAWLWGESTLVAFMVCSLLRYCYVLHATWTVNSFAHMYGYRPYDKFINPRESFVSNITSLGEGWHNYHHTFPFDYRASEWNWTINLTTFLLDMLAMVGLVYDRKQVSQATIDAKRARSGAKDESILQQFGMGT